MTNLPSITKPKKDIWPTNLVIDAHNDDPRSLVVFLAGDLCSITAEPWVLTTED